MKSLGRRLGVSLFVSLLLAGLLVGEALLWWLDQAQRAGMARHLHDEAASVLAAMVVGPGGPALRVDRLDPAYRAPLSGRYFVVWSPRRRWRSPSLAGAALPAPLETGLDTALEPGPRGQQWLRYRARYRLRGQPVTVVVAQDYGPQLKAFRHIRVLGLIAWLLVLAGLALVQLGLIRRGLRPLTRAGEQIGQLRGGRRAQLDEDVVAELRPLVTEVNRLQHHTEAQLQRSRNALGDLGHALKTPLAVLRHRCDEGLRRSDPALHRLLDEQLGQIEATVRRALGRARVAAGATAANRFDPPRDLPLLVDTVRRAHHRVLDVRIDGPRLPPQPVERDDMLEVLGNLLDNAFKWARGQVRVSLEQDVGRLRLVVEDDGPGIAPDRRETVLRRGERLDRRTPGHGLGLAIVSDTVDAYGGRLILGRGEHGGLRVVIELPLDGGEVRPGPPPAGATPDR